MLNYLSAVALAALVCVNVNGIVTCTGVVTNDGVVVCTTVNGITTCL